MLVSTKKVAIEHLSHLRMQALWLKYYGNQQVSGLVCANANHITADEIFFQTSGAALKDIRIKEVLC